jgi:uncharacterized membrane protein HdeD (DUF308 family)
MPGALSTASRSWWLLLVTGIAWILLSIIVCRFDYSTVEAISVLFGVLVLATAANEILVATMSSGARRVLHLVLAAVFTVIGIVLPDFSGILRHHHGHLRQLAGV